MAALAFGLIGTAIGAGIGGGITLLGATITAASIGGAIGTAIGGYVDSLILASLTPAIRNEGPRLQEMTVMQSSEGAHIGRLYGIMRVGGNVIWSARFKETKTTETETVGGKGGGGGQKVENTTYTYTCSFAVAFGEGSSRHMLGRLWMDGKEIDLTTIAATFYSGTETQAPDSVIQSIEGPSKTPAFRGICYMVFENMALAQFSNRIPQITAELIAPIKTSDPDDISNIARAFCLIPGSGEFVYGTEVYTLQNATSNILGSVFSGGSFTNQVGNAIGLPSRSGNSLPAKFMNMHNQSGEPDFIKSLRQLGVLQPHLGSIALVVGWFGDDLRVGECQIKPMVEYKNRDGVVTPREWNVAGYVRSDTDIPEVGRDNLGNPIYGGTPSDDVVVEAIRWLKAQGYRVLFYPFVFMHVIEGNTLPNPYSNNAATLGQPLFPWRGRITCSPAAGFTGSVDKTAAAATQVDTFFTRTWGFNRYIQHYAQLCADAGGVDAFLIGSEMVGLTTIRSNANTYPAVARFKTLAASVSSIMGSGTLVSYAADWSEYNSHRPTDGSNDLYFHLDPLWSDANIDFVAVDNYLPLSDWRDGSTHLDYDADNGIVTPHNIDYLKSNIEGGEGYDWFYASSNDRDNQVRTPITDGMHSKPWVFRPKDFRNWWQEQHINRPGGTESGGPTAWVPESKPIWFTEFGCPCVDKGTNQPNVFYDPKSSESFFPYYSTGQQDEYISRVYAEAMLQYWRDNSPAGMIDIEDMFIWCWDSRPFPDYPARTDVWSDGDLWRYGHWMTGRIAYPALPRLIENLCEEVGVTDHDTERLNGTQGLVKGYFVDSPTAIRDVIGQLMTAFQFDAFESEGKIKFALKSTTALVPLSEDSFVSSESDPMGFSITRMQDSELPKHLIVDFMDADNDYTVSSLDAKRHQTSNVEVSSIRLPVSLAPDYVRGLADSILHQAWVARESGAVKLPPSMFKLDPGDGITFPIGDRVGQARITSIDTGEFREVQFQAFDLSLYNLPVYPVNTKSRYVSRVPGFPELYVLDIPLYSGNEPSHWSPRLATFARPWPGTVSVFHDQGAGGPEDWVLARSLNLENVMGVIVDPVGTDRTGCWLRNAVITVRLLGGTMPSATEAQVLNGSNICAMQNDDGHWELFQYATATLNPDGSYSLSTLIRGQLGTEWVMDEATFSTGNAFVLLENQFSINPSSAPYFPLTPGDRDVLQKARFGSAYKSIDDDNAYLETTFTHEAMAQKPYAPVQLKARWNLDVNNDIALSWVRRSRFGGDPWETTTIPLNEEVEEYELEILNGSTVVREVTGLSVPSYTYTNAMQVADFGSAQTTALKFRVYQMSSSIGRGIAAEETIAR